MVIIKEWKDYDTCRKDSDRIEVVYGAGRCGLELAYAGVVSPTCFLDQNVPMIEKVMMDDKKSIPVMTIEDFVSLKQDADIIVAVAYSKWDPKTVAEELAEAFSQSDTANYIYYYNEQDKSHYRLGGKVTIHNWNDLVSFWRNSLFDQIWRDHIRDAFMDHNTLTDEDYKDMFFGDLIKLYFSSIEGGIRYEELNRQHVIITNGRRHTCSQPNQYDKQVFVFGDSRMLGVGSRDQYTTCSLLQAKLNDSELQYKFRVRNEAINGADLPILLFQLRRTNVSPGDIVFFAYGIWELASSEPGILEMCVEFLVEANQYCLQRGCQFIFVDLPDIYDKDGLTPWERHFLDDLIIIGQAHHISNEKIKEEVAFKRSRLAMFCSNKHILYYGIAQAFLIDKHTIFLDSAHWGEYGEQIIAKQLFQIVCAYEERSNIHNDVAARKREFERDKLAVFLKTMFSGAGEYLAKLQSEYSLEGGNISVGAIVMNCNPFTRGHRFLIEQAAGQVERLYIFVVQEDQSAFLFKDRFDMVREGVKDLGNVVVLPSGQFIISAITFPGYFMKEGALDDYEPDSEADLLFFATCIAPALDISIRFVGEEPNCIVTNSYNQKMKEVLPYYGVEVSEIPRLQANGEVISASAVRRLLDEGDMREIEHLVPESTLMMLKKIKERTLKGAQMDVKGNDQWIL